MATVMEVLLGGNPYNGSEDLTFQSVCKNALKRNHLRLIQKHTIHTFKLMRNKQKEEKSTHKLQQKQLDSKPKHSTNPNLAKWEATTI